MVKISKQLRKYFITISILSIAFITITSNISINFFFSGYIRDSRSRDDLKVLKYVESVFSEYEEINDNSSMNLMHYAFSEDVVIQIKDTNNSIMFNSSAFGTIIGITDEYSKNEEKFSFRSYPFIIDDEQVGTIDIGRPKSIIANIEDVRWVFKKMKNIYDEISTMNLRNTEMKYLSMGMTNDFEIAIEEGSNIIRIGTAIFGARKYKEEE